MKVLFLNVSCSGSRYFPTGLAILMSILKEKLAEVSLFDTNFIYIKDRRYNLDYIGLSNKIGQHKKVDNDEGYMVLMCFSELVLNLQRYIDEINPSLIAISAMSPSYPLVIELMHYVKIPAGCKTAIGGFHCKVAPEEVISESFFDYVFEFESEISFPMLYEYLEGRNKSISIEMIDGLYWKKEDGSIVHNKLEKLPDLSVQHDVDLSEFDEKYFTRPYDGKLKRIINYETSRGCPYSCAPCINSTINKVRGMHNYHRIKPVFQVIKELQSLIKRYNFELIVFMDESFLNRPLENLKEFADIYDKYVHLPFTIFARPETIIEEKVITLKKMNCASVSIGVESGNPQIRNKILNRSMSDDSIIEAFDLLNKYKIRNSSLNMIGIPTETEEDIWKTIRLNRRLRPSTISVAILYPYKGSAIREFCLREGYLSKEKAEDLLNPISSSILDLPGLDASKITYYYENFINFCRKNN